MGKDNMAYMHGMKSYSATKKKELPPSVTTSETNTASGTETTIWSPSICAVPVIPATTIQIIQRK